MKKNAGSIWGLLLILAITLVGCGGKSKPLSPTPTSPSTPSYTGTMVDTIKETFQNGTSNAKTIVGYDQFETIQTTVNPPGCGFGWGGFVATAGQQKNAIVIHSSNNLTFYGLTSDSKYQYGNMAGSYVYTVFDSKGGKTPDQAVDMSSGTFVINYRTDLAADQDLKLLIRDSVGDWYLSNAVTFAASTSATDKTISVSGLTWYKVDDKAAGHMNNKATNRNTNAIQPAGTAGTPKLEAVTGTGIYIVTPTNDVPLQHLRIMTITLQKGASETPTPTPSLSPSPSPSPSLSPSPSPSPSPSSTVYTVDLSTVTKSTGSTGTVVYDAGVVTVTDVASFYFPLPAGLSIDSGESISVTISGTYTGTTTKGFRSWLTENTEKTRSTQVKLGWDNPTVAIVSGTSFTKTYTLTENSSASSATITRLFFKGYDYSSKIENLTINSITIAKP